MIKTMLVEQSIVQSLIMELIVSADYLYCLID